MKRLVTHLGALRFIRSFSSPIVFLFCIAFAIGMPYRASALTWTLQPGAPAQPFSGVAESADGQIIVVGVDGGTEQGVYRSTDGGVTWNEVLTAANSGNEPWASFAMSSDGTHVVGVQTDGHIWLSANSGLTWSQVGPTAADNWYAVTMTADGQYVAAASASDGVVELSSDYGGTWAAAPNISAKEWDTIAYSPDGAYLAVGAATTTPSLAVSTDKGTTWTEGLGSTAPWYGLAAADGGVLIGGGANVLYYSNDEGTVVVDTGVNDTGNWDWAATTPNGQEMLASTDNGHVWFSDDPGGNVWQQQTATGTVQWSGVALSSDGTKGVALDSTDSLLYTFVADVPNAPTITAATPASTSVALTFTAPADDGGSPLTDYVIEYSPAGLNTWSTFADGVSTTTSVTVTGLSSDRSYDFRVSAVNRMGTSTPSSTQSATTKPTVSSSGFHGGSIIPITHSQATGQSENTELQQLTAEYQKLLAELHSLSAVPPVASSTDATSTISVRDLSTGSQGTDVAQLQNILVAAKTGPAAAALAANGSTTYFGSLTKAALVEYQQAHAITPASGYFGPLTRAQMQKQGVAGIWW